MIVSDAKAAANRANAQASTGPRSAQGKARVRRNAYKHGLYADTVVDAGEDQAAFTQLHVDYLDRYAPRGTAETALVAQLASIMWRLLRVPGAELAVYAGHEQDFAPGGDDEAEVAVDLPELWARAHGAGGIDSAIARINRHEAHLQRMAQRTLDMLNALQGPRAGAAEPRSLTPEEFDAAEAGVYFEEIGEHLDALGEEDRQMRLGEYLQVLYEHTGVPLGAVQEDGTFEVIAY